MKVYVGGKVHITFYLDRGTKKTDSEIEQLRDGKVTLETVLQQHPNGEELKTVVTLRRDVKDKEKFTVMCDDILVARDGGSDISKCKKLDIVIGDHVYDTTLDKFGFAPCLGYGGIYIKEGVPEISS